MAAAVAARKHALRMREKEERALKSRKAKAAKDLKKQGVGMESYHDKPDWPNISESPSLYAACFRGREDTVAELLKRRARGEILPTSSSPRATTTSLGKYEVADDAETADEGKLLTEDDKKKKADDKRRAEAHALEREKVFFGRVPLHAAAMRGHLGVAKLLLDAGDNPTETTRDGRTALHIAAYNGEAEICKLLLQKPATLVNQKDNDSCTALNYAARAKQLEACRVLIEFGADALQVDSEGKSPMAHACRSKNEELIAVVVDCAQRNRDGWRKQIRKEKQRRRGGGQLSTLSVNEKSEVDTELRKPVPDPHPAQSPGSAGFELPGHLFARNSEAGRGSGTESSAAVHSPAPEMMADTAQLKAGPSPVDILDAAMQDADITGTSSTSSVLDCTKAVLKLNESLRASVNAGAADAMLGKSLLAVVESNSQLVETLRNHLKAASH